MAVHLTDEEFALLYEYLDREQSVTWDPHEVAKTVVIGDRLWERVQEIAQESDFTPTHAPVPPWTEPIPGDD